MIAKRIDRQSLDRFGRLALYIAAAKDPGEKLDALWIEGCEAGTEAGDLDLAIIEVEATQRRNTRSAKDKTYHLLVSFRHEQPELATLREIERAFAEALGFADHQRVIGTHRNTENFHMHVAYNKVHPATHRNRTPHRDFKALERCCREMEKRFGLQVDLGREDKAEARANLKARDMEAHTWQQSFASHVQGLKPRLMEALDKARSWEDLHASLGRHGLTIKKRGNGLVIVDAGGGQAIKASSLDRAFAAKALHDRFGAYQPPGKEPAPSRYRRRPAFKHPNNARLWRRYLGLKRQPGGMATWKQFLMLQLALNDPLAAAIILYRQKMLAVLDGPARTMPVAPPAIGGTARASSPAPAPAPSPDPWQRPGWADPKTNAYLVATGVRAFGVKDDGAGGVIVPGRDANNRRRVLYQVTPDGEGRFLSPAPPGLMHVIDPKRRLAEGAPIVIAPDYATAAGLHQATGAPAVMAFTADNLGPVAEVLRARYPGRRIVIAADPANVVQATRAAENTGSLVAAAPNGTFNDLMRDKGPAAGRRALAGLLGPHLGQGKRLERRDRARRPVIP